MNERGMCPACQRQNRRKRRVLCCECWDLAPRQARSDYDRIQRLFEADRRTASDFREVIRTLVSESRRAQFGTLATEPDMTEVLAAFE